MPYGSLAPQRLMDERNMASADHVAAAVPPMAQNVYQPDPTRWAAAVASWPQSMHVEDRRGDPLGPIGMEMLKQRMLSPSWVIDAAMGRADAREISNTVPRGRGR